MDSTTIFPFYTYVSKDKPFELEFRQLKEYFNFRRQFKQEKLDTSKYGKIIPNEYYLIDKTWLNKWKEFVGYNKLSSFNINRDLNDKDYDILFKPNLPKNINEIKLLPLDNSNIYNEKGEINPLAEFIIINKKCQEVFGESRQNISYNIIEKPVPLTFSKDKIILHINNITKLFCFRVDNTNNTKKDMEIIINFDNQKNANKILSFIEKTDFKFWLKDKSCQIDGPDELDIEEEGCKMRVINKNVKLRLKFDRNKVAIDNQIKSFGIPDDLKAEIQTKMLDIYKQTGIIKESQKNATKKYECINKKNKTIKNPIYYNVKSNTQFNNVSNNNINTQQNYNNIQNHINPFISSQNQYDSNQITNNVNNNQFTNNTNNNKQFNNNANNNQFTNNTNNNNQFNNNANNNQFTNNTNNNQFNNNANNNQFNNMNYEQNNYNNMANPANMNNVNNVNNNIYPNNYNNNCINNFNMNMFQQNQMNIPMQMQMGIQSMNNINMNPNMQMFGINQFNMCSQNPNNMMNLSMPNLDVRNQNSAPNFKPNMNNILNSTTNISKNPLLAGITYPHKAGLYNVGQSCYMNATLECLSNVRKLSNKLLESYGTFDIDQQPLCVSYSSLLFDLLHTKEKSIRPILFKQIIGKLNPLFEGNHAADAKDLIFFLIETMHKELQNPDTNINNKEINFAQQELDAQNEQKMLNDFFAEYNSNRTIVSDIFYGTNRTIMKCHSCRITKYSFQTFNLLIFPLKKVKEFKQRNRSFNMYRSLDLNLYDAFACEQEEEKLEGENMIYCNNCRQLAPGSHKQDFYTLPPILIIILNRGKNNQDFNEYFKFDETLDFTDKNIIINNQSYKKYYLCGIITHLGESGSSGHFIAYCRNNINDNFLCYNDDSVSPVSVLDAMSAKISYEANERKTPYILLYHYMN